MSNDKRLNPEDAAKKLQGMVSLGIPDTKFSVPPASIVQMPENIQEEEKKSDQPEQISTPVRRKRKEQPESYREIYFRRVDFSDRQPLYITRLTHDKLMMIVNLIV